MCHKYWKGNVQVCPKMCILLNCAFIKYKDTIKKMIIINCSKLKEYIVKIRITVQSPANPPRPTSPAWPSSSVNPLSYAPGPKTTKKKRRKTKERDPHYPCCSD